MFRSILLYLARSKAARPILMGLPGARRVSRRFVAGETLDAAIETTRVLNADGLLVTLDHLGESVTDEKDANRATDDYIKLLDRIAATGVKSNVSLKLTALGLDVSEQIGLRNLRCIVEHAAKHGNFVRIDMESSAYTDKTLRLFRHLRHEHGLKNVGVVIQAYLFRSEADVRELAAEGVNIRLCKGAYNEPPTVAFPAKADVDKNFIRLTQIYLDSRSTGAYIGIATHDDKMIEAAKAHAAERGIARDQFEFQMLYGVRGAALRQLAAEGYKARVYVPYGTEWYPYYMRRLAERPANVLFMLRNFFRA